MDSNHTTQYQTIIGLEVHAKLATNTKIFNSDATTYGQPPNQNVSAITLGHPGTLPILNHKVIELAIRMGLACDSRISKEMIFDRKNYFYPDLPKGYQITQDRTPICVGGYVPIQVGDSKKKIALNRVHLEEDAGKSIHTADTTDTLVDFNRAGVPLIEIVTEPVLNSSSEAHAFLTEVRKLVRYLEICDGNMEEGSLRCDANVSLRLMSSDELGSKVEIKNLNSIRNVERAIDHEVARQTALLDSGQAIISETRNFDADTGTTSGLRSKETLNDYRYFPDPDLSPVVITEDFLKEIHKEMPELPWQIFERFTVEIGLSKEDAKLLSEKKETAAYIEELVRLVGDSRIATNWMIGPVRTYLNDTGKEITEFDLTPNRLNEIITLVKENKLSFSIASQRLFPKFLVSNEDALTLAQQLDLLHESNESSIEQIIDQILVDFPEKVNAFRKGKKGLMGMFMGELMKRTGGKADPKKSNELLRKKLS